MFKNNQEREKAVEQLKEDIKSVRLEQLIYMINEAPFLKDNVYYLYTKQEREEIRQKLISILNLIFDINALQLKFNDKHLEELKTSDSLHEFLNSLLNPHHL